LRELNQTNITAQDIIYEFKNIDDVDRKSRFFDKLKRNLNKEEVIEFKDF
jgi:hypothetical protein